MSDRLYDDVVARGRRTVVRRKRLADVDDEFRWRSDAELAQFDASRPAQTPFANYERNWSFDFRFTDMPHRSFAIEAENGRHIGNVMYYNFDQARGEAEIGISIGERDYWDGGYGTDALLALVARAIRRRAPCSASTCTRSTGTCARSAASARLASASAALPGVTATPS